MPKSTLFSIILLDASIILMYECPHQKHEAKMQYPHHGTMRCDEICWRWRDNGNGIQFVTEERDPFGEPFDDFDAEFDIGFNNAGDWNITEVRALRKGIGGTAYQKLFGDNFKACAEHISRKMEDEIDRQVAQEVAETLYEMERESQAWQREEALV